MNYDLNSMTKTFFFDSYALFEIIFRNKNYQPYLDAQIILTKLNLFEVYYALLREDQKSLATTFIQKYSDFSIDFNQQTIEEAAHLKFFYKKNKLSMTDCIGYILAKKLEIKFLTGDKQFEYLENVEYVK